MHKFRIFTRMNIAVLLCCFLMTITGIVGGWTSPMMQKLNGTEDNPLKRILTENEISLLASIPVLGSISGSFLFGFLAEMIGKKSTITLMGLPYIIFFCVMSFSRTYWLYVVGRFVSGVGIGGVIVCLPVYICELSHPQSRRRIMTLMYVSLNLGTLITFCSSSYLSFHCYHYVFLILPLSFVVLFGIFGIESPYSVIKEDVKKAELILIQLRGKYNIDQELQEIRDSVLDTSGMRGIDSLIAKNTNKSLVVALALTIFLTSLGSLAILSYIHFILNSAGGTWPTQTDTVVLGIVQILTTIASSNVSHNNHRKQLLTISYLVATFSQGVLGVYFLMKPIGIDTTSYLGLIPLASLILYIIAYNIQITLTGLISGEIFPLRVRTLVNLICAVYTGLAGFLVVFYFNKMQKTIGLAQCFLMFSVCGFVAFVFAVVILVDSDPKMSQRTRYELVPDSENSPDKIRTVYGSI